MEIRERYLELNAHSKSYTVKALVKEGLEADAPFEFKARGGAGGGWPVGKGSLLAQCSLCAVAWNVARAGLGCCAPR